MKTIMYKYILVFLFIAKISFSLSAQPLSSVIPEDAYFIMRVSPESVYKKIAPEKLANATGFQDFFSDIAGSLEEKSGLPVAAVWREPAKLGIDLNQDFYIYLDGHLNACFLFSLSDVTLFDQWWHEQVTNIAVGNQDGQRLLAGESLTIYWNDHIGMIRAKESFGALANLGNMGADEEFVPLPDEIFAQPGSAISDDTRFESDAKGHDLFLWVNYARLYQMQNQMINALGSRLNVSPPPAIDSGTDNDTSSYDYAEAETYDTPTYEDGYTDGYDTGFEEALSIYGIDTTAAFLNRQVDASDMTDESLPERWPVSDTSDIAAPMPEEDIAMEEDFEDDLEADYPSDEDIYLPDAPPPPPAGMRQRDPFSGVMEQLFNPETMMKRLEMLNHQLRVSAAVDFNKGSLEATFKTYSNPVYMEIFKAANDNRPNRHMIKYLPADRLIFASSFSVNPENIYKSYKDYFIPLIDSSGLISDFMEVYGIFLDEEAIFKMIEGDFLFAMTGITEIRTTKMEYVQEGEEGVMKEVEVSQPMPELLLMLTYKDDSNWKKLLKMGVRHKILTRKGDLYTINKIKDLPEFYIAFQKKIMMITNNRDLIQNKLNTGYTGGSRIRGVLKKQLLSHNQSAYVDITNLMTAIKNMSLTGLSGELENVQRQEFRSLSLWTENKAEDSVRSRMVFKMGPPSANVLETILHILDEINEQRDSKM